MAEASLYVHVSEKPHCSRQVRGQGGLCYCWLRRGWRPTQESKSQDEEAASYGASSEGKVNENVL